MIFAGTLSSGSSPPVRSPPVIINPPIAIAAVKTCLRIRSPVLEMEKPVGTKNTPEIIREEAELRMIVG